MSALHNHQLNQTERVISTFKHHIIVVLAECDKNSQNIHDANKYQKVVMLSMFCQSITNPKLTAYDQVFDIFNYQQTPLVPLRTKISIYEYLEQRKL